MQQPLAPELLLEALHAEATLLAGDLGALAQRAAVYHHLYQDSGGNNVFPLIAAHGALWGGEYFRKGLAASRVLAWQYCYKPARMTASLATVNALADAFRDINRRVCIEAYTVYHLTRELGLCALTRERVPSPLLEGLLECHEAWRLGKVLAAPERAALFEAFFHWEQRSIVAAAVDAAFAAFHWRAVKQLALQPRIGFAYFPDRQQLPFTDFSSSAERIEKGMSAYAIAEGVGMKAVEASLRDYGALPESFFRDPELHFLRMRGQLLRDRRRTPGASQGARPVLAKSTA